jgi:decaprenyl-phosphate phosphoribosyltransferase
MIILDIANLIRIKDWAKNCIIFLPLLFSGYLLNISHYTSLILGFTIFSLISSCIYILNDILDLQDDLKHPKKKYSKPLASAKVSLGLAYVILLLFIILSIILIYFCQEILYSSIIYISINLFYNIGIKKIAYFEVLLISIGYIVRIDAGSNLINVESSILMIMAIYSLALFFLLLKRLAEMNVYSDIPEYKSRYVLKFYTKSSLKYLSLISLLLLLIILFLYVFTVNSRLIFSFILVVYFLISYFKLTIDETYGENPISYVFSNKKLLMTAVLSLCFSLIIYI